MASTKTISPTTYAIVLVTLVLLTIGTVAISFLEISGTWHLLLGLSIGVVKAVLVAVFFMHLIHSGRTTWGVVAVALFWLIIVLLGLTFTDYAARTTFPFVPGH